MYTRDTTARRGAQGVETGSVDAARAYCRLVVPQVSRTFALNIRVLPAPLRDAIGQAYLFCRMADTVEDSRALGAARRVELLQAFATLFPLGPRSQDEARAWSRAFVGLEAYGNDHALCLHAELVFRAFAALAPELRAPVEACVREMALGMRDFARRRLESPGGVLQLEDSADLERYCHVVAGTVGTMLVRLFAVTSARIDPARQERLQALAETFGQAMQVTNIVKDVADDAQGGVCFVPRALAARYRLAPEALLEPGHRAEARLVLRELGALAARALDAALVFALLLPRREVRLRLFCLWPIFLAAGTLCRVLRDDAVFVAGARPRLRRAEVRRALVATTLAVLSDRALRWLYGRRRAALQAALGAA